MARESWYQYFFPEYRTILGIPDDPSIVAIDPVRSLDPLTTLISDSETISHQLSQLQTTIPNIGSLIGFDLDSLSQHLHPDTLKALIEARNSLFLRERQPQPLLTADLSEQALEAIRQEQTAKLARLVESGFLPKDYLDPLIIQATDEKSQSRLSQEKLYQKRVALFQRMVSGSGWPKNLQEQTDDIPPDNLPPFVARYNDGQGAFSILISWGIPMYEAVEELYQRQQEGSGELLLPFKWFFHDFYWYRGAWWLQGLPDKDQSDEIDYEMLKDVVLPNSLIFRLDSPPSPGIPSITGDISILH